MNEKNGSGGGIEMDDYSVWFALEEKWERWCNRSWGCLAGWSLVAIFVFCFLPTNLLCVLLYSLGAVLFVVVACACDRKKRQVTTRICELLRR